MCSLRLGNVRNLCRKWFRRRGSPSATMTPARVNPLLVSQFPSLAKISDDLFSVGKRFAVLSVDPVPKGPQEVRGISWRCKAIANANILRGEELFRFAILAI